MPKRSSERRRRNVVPGETVVQRDEPVRVPGLPRTMAVHPVMRRWYNAVKASGQSEYFEPSDWAAAQFLVEAGSRLLNGSHFSSVLFASVWSAMESLLTTEASRRRARMEVERAIDEGEAAPTAIEKYRKAVTS